MYRAKTLRSSYTSLWCNYEKERRPVGKLQK